GLLDGSLACRRKRRPELPMESAPAAVGVCSPRAGDRHDVRGGRLHAVPRRPRGAARTPRERYSLGLISTGPRRGPWIRSRSTPWLLSPDPRRICPILAVSLR